MKKDQTPKRKNMHDQIDKARNKTPRRKAKNDQIDKVRDATPKRPDRKLQLSDYDCEMYQSDEDEIQLSDDQLFVDINHIYFNTTQNFKLKKSTEDEWTQDQTAMFLNMYCEDTNIPTVAPRRGLNFCMPF